MTFFVEPHIGNCLSGLMVCVQHPPLLFSHITCSSPLLLWSPASTNPHLLVQSGEMGPYPQRSIKCLVAASGLQESRPARYTWCDRKTNFPCCHQFLIFNWSWPYLGLPFVFIASRTSLFVLFLHQRHLGPKHQHTTRPKHKQTINNNDVNASRKNRETMAPKNRTSSVAAASPASAADFFTRGKKPTTTDRVITVKKTTDRKSVV